MGSFVKKNIGFLVPVMELESIRVFSFDLKYGTNRPNNSYTKKESPEPARYSAACRTFDTLILSQPLNNYNYFLVFSNYYEVFYTLGG